MQYGNDEAYDEMIRMEKGLNRTMQYGNILEKHSILRPISLFKSYYVVWKLANMGRIIPIAAGLNRTMQYGNNIFLGTEM